ncbi:MAG: LysR substrate-binding domain-containing protein [Pseudomonadota bacterium]
MRYVQLRAFHHVAISGGFSRAAAALHLTQPAISDQVRRLEDDYDVLLFDRRRKQVVLTEAGKSLLAITRRLFEAERHATDLLSETRALRAGHLRIHADAALHVSQPLAAFRAQFPGVRVSIASGNSAQVVEALKTYEADIGVVGEPPGERGFDQVPLGASPIVACVSQASDLASRASLSLADLARHPLVLREPGSRTRTLVLAAAARAGITLAPAIEAEGREAVREIVASGAGIGFVSQAEFGRDDRLTAIPLATDEPLLMEEFALCLSNRRQGYVIGAFLDLVSRSVQADATGRPT